MTIPASVEKAYLQPPDPKIVECALCGNLVSEEDAVWEDDMPFCCEGCCVEYFEEYAYE